MKPMVGPAARTTAHMSDVIFVPQIVTHLSLCRTTAIEVVPVALSRQSYVKRKRSAPTGYPWGWPVLPWSMDYPLTPFLCGE